MEEGSINTDPLLIYNDVIISNNTSSIYYECDEYIYMYMSNLGPLYDISIRKRSHSYKNSSLSSLIISKKLINIFHNRIIDVLKTRSKWRLMLMNDFEDESIDIDNDLLNRQATIFISLIIENYDMKRCSSSLIEASPALHALRQCFLSGWRPQNLPLKFIYILLSSLNNSGNIDDIFNVISVTKEIIEMIISYTPEIKQKIMISLLKLFNNTSIFGLYHVSLLLECSDFLSHSLMHEIIKNIINDNEFSNTTTGINKTIKELNEKWRNSLSLGDNIELKVNMVWFTGIVVKIDSVKETILVEYQDSKMVLNTITISRHSEDIKQIKVNIEDIQSIHNDNNIIDINNNEIYKYSSRILSLVFGDNAFFKLATNDTDLKLNEVNAMSQVINNPYLTEIIMALYQLDFVKFENISNNRSIGNSTSSLTVSLLSSFTSLLDKTLISKIDISEIWVNKSYNNEQKEENSDNILNDDDNITTPDNHNVALKVYDILAITIFQNIIHEILLLFEDYIDHVLENKSINNNVIDLAIQVINKISSSSNVNMVLVPFLYRNLYFRYKLHLQQYVNELLKDPTFYIIEKRIENFRKAIIDIKEIEKPYSYLFKNCCRDDMNTSFLINKLEYITKIYGTGKLADHILDNIRINSNDINGIQGLMHYHILMTTNRFCYESKRARNFIRMISDFVSPKYNDILNNIWINVIAEVTIKTCSKIKLNDVVAPNDVVDNLLLDLIKVREISITDMASLSNCNINTDIAFSVAFKRLSKEFAIKIAKALAVRISKLLDSLKFGIHYSESYNYSINQMADLIQVLCNDSSEDFEHYYEILLARRLLWGRYMSTQNERQVLRVLPAMIKSTLMINDIEKTSEQMTFFRKFLLARLDQKELQLPVTMKTLVFDNGIDVHVLAGTVWQSALVSPLSYSSLKLDAGIKAIYEEYEMYFKLRDISAHESNAVESLHSFPSITISAADGHLYPYIGTYEPSIESSNGFPLYTHIDVAYVLEYSIKRKAWELKSKINRGSDRYIAFFNCESFTAIPQSWPTYSSWLIKTKEGWKSVTFNIVIGQRQQLFASQLPSVTELQVHKFKSTKRLHWCHGAGSAILKANLNEQKCCYIFASAPIATLLLIYNNDSRQSCFTLKELCVESGLPFKEIEDIVMILSNSNLGILERESSVSGGYRLSQKFLNGCLGGDDIDDPIKIPLIQMPDLLSTDSLSSVHGWRNELIDASIVRLLKDVARQKTGEFHNKEGVSNCAIPQDVLLLLVREDLAKRMHVDSKDIMGRGERLVSIGVIEKISLNTNSFRSVAYAYLPEIENDRNTSSDTPQPKESKSYDKVTGDELYGHLRIILRIRTLPVGCPGISKESFIRNFILWMAYTPCRLLPNFDKPMLAFFKDILHDYLQMFYIQKFALIKQHEEGVQENTDTDGNKDDDFKKYSSKINYHFSNTKALINFSLNYHKILFHHLPIETIILIIKAFRKMQPKKMNSKENGNETQGHRDTNETPNETPKWDQSISIPFNKLGFYLHPALWCHLGLDGQVSGKEHIQESYNSRRGFKSPDPPQVHFNLRSNFLEQLNCRFTDSTVRSTRFTDSALPTSLPSMRFTSINPPISQYKTAYPYNNAKSINPPKPASDNDYFEDSKGDETDEFTLTFDSFVRAIFLATSINESKLSCSFAELLMNFLYINVRNFVREIFERDGPKNVIETGLTSKFGVDEPVFEAFLPCEICNDCFAISQLDRHQRLCSAIMRGAAGGLDGLMNPPTSRSPKSKDKNPPSAKLIESKWSDENLLPLIESLFNLLITEFTPAIASNDEASRDDERSKDNDEASRDDERSKDPFLNLRLSLELLFSTLDVNSDGFLTSEDFVSKMILKVDSIDVDPVRLYSPDRKGNNDSNPFAEDKTDIRDNDDHNDDDDNFIDISKLSLFPSMERVDSLWASVSNDQIVPNVTSTKSLKGLDETELEMHSILDRTCEIINESEGTTASLLLHYKWDEKTLVEEYIENQIAVRLAVGLGPKTHPPFLRFDIFGRRTVNKKGESLKSVPIDCGICGELADEDEMFSLNCFHWYCQNCWENYLRVAITDREVKVSCPCSDCKMIVTLDMIKFLCNSELYAEARKLQVKAFVEEKRDRKVMATYCKNPIGCNGVLLMAEDANCTEATCSLCASSYCFVCDLPPHAPVPCDLLADWEQRGGYLETGQDADMEARKIKQLTTKPCPKCGTRIEKNGGCPHMSCRCKYQFCWECGGDYHTSVSCTRTKVTPDAGSILHFDQMDKEVANHFLARKVAIKGKAECIKQLSTLNQNYTSMLRIKIEGWDVLSKAQSALAHSCMLRFFLNSVKLEFVFDAYKKLSQDLQRKFEETWVSYDSFPQEEAKAAIRNLKSRLTDYLLDVNTELNPISISNRTNNAQITSKINENKAYNVFGNAFS